MSTMSERIKSLRKNIGLNQTEFGQKIGVKQTTIAGYETGKKNPMDAVINSICREFSVNEDWIRNGKEPIFLPVDADVEFEQIAAEIGLSDDEFIKKLLKSYWGLDAKEKAVIRKLIDGLSTD